MPDLETAYQNGEAILMDGPDMGLFPPASERALRFMCSYEIDQAIASTSGPIEIATVGSGFPWIAAMQANEHLKRCDSVAKNISGQVNQAVNNFDFSDMVDDETARQYKTVLQQSTIKQYVRTAVADTLYDPPATLVDPAIKGGHRSKTAINYMTAYFQTADAVIARKNEPASNDYRRNGGWELATFEPDTPLAEELAARLGSAEKATMAIQTLGRITAGLLPDKLRPFSVKVLDTRSSDELLAQAEVMYDDYPEVVETEMYHHAEGLARNHAVQTTDYDLSALTDEGVSTMIISHWPLRQPNTGNADDANWAVLLSQINRKLRTNGIAVFFPWKLPRSFNPEHLDITLGGVQAMMLNEYRFDVHIASEPQVDLIKAIANFGQEPAMLAPQMRDGGDIGRLIARKRRTLKALFPGS